MTTEQIVSLPNGLSLSIAEHGAGPEPALVLVPGPTDAWRSYATVLACLPATIRTIAVSMRGHGDSDKPPTGYRVEDFAGDVGHLLAELGIERAVLAGHSGSCLFIRRAALDLGRRVAGLVLEASPLRLIDLPEFEHFFTSVVAGLRDPIDPDFARGFALGTSTDALDPDLADMLVDDLLKVPAAVWQQMFAGLGDYDDLDELRRLSVPALLIWGDADLLVPRAAQDALLGLLGDAALRVYRGIGHTPRWEDPARFAADVAAFVDTVC